ncbi:carbohydrate-binding module family 35 protein [Annulohypoxylon moriforme]|nr:carbohydrate-binding module family 35 protein [Annulohypoxylon moriforme]
MRFLNAVLFATLSPLASASLQVVPGGTWTTSNGEHLQAHGAGVIKVGDRYYLIGEDKTNGSAFQHVNCYSSADLVQWTYEGALLSRTSSGDLGPNRVVERPKVLYNESTKKYVLYMHIDSSSYGEAKVGVATGDEVCGQYTYVGSFQPLSHQSRDMGLFQDDDGAGYLLTEDRQNGLRIDKLSDDYLSVDSSTYLWSDSIEAPAMLKHDGVYYMFGSHLTGWDPNDNVYSTSTSLASGWSSWKTFADVGSKTYTSQTNYVLPVGPNAAIYLGDRWVSSNLMASTYVWLPLTISGTTVTMANAESWVPNLNTTSSSASTTKPAETAYEGEAALYGGSTRDVSCSACSGGKAAGYVGGPDQGTVSFQNISSDVATRTTVRVRYVNGDSTPRYVNVRVNSGNALKLAFLPTGSSVSSSTMNIDLNAGDDNLITFQAVGDGYGPDIDRLIVPVS